MTALSDPERARARFLKAELELGFTFTTIASQNYETGHRESAGKSMVNAEKAYETVTRFLSDPKNSKSLTGAEIRDITAELERLREKLLKLEAVRAQREIAR
jgi:hypothetical protein